MRINILFNFLKEHTLFPKLSKWIFFLLLIVFSLIYNYQNILFLAPQSLHQWRQADCLSITLNYYQDHNPFLQPAIHNLGSDGSGKTISEFPLIYYTVAQLFKVFGYHEFIYRLLNLSIFFCGLFALFKIFENTLKESFYAIVLSLFLFTSPMIVYYANNFLMNSTALSLAFIGLYFFYRFFKESKNKDLYLMTLFFSLAGLLKITSLLSFIAIFGVFVIELLNIKLLPDRKIFQYPKRQIFPLLAVFLIQIIWYSYANSYNAKYNSGIFLIGILPIWKLNTFQIKEIISAIIDHIKWDYFRRETELIFLIMFLSLFVFYKKSNKLLLFLTFTISIGFILFILLFFQALKDHDYYTLDMSILIPFIILAFFVFLKNNFRKVFNSLLLKIIVLSFLIHNIDFARRRIRDRYSSGGWQNENYIKYVKIFEEITPYNRSLGIRPDDKVLSLSDQSINISLYLMNQKGWTNYGMISSDSNKIKETIKLGAKYLFIYNKEIYKEKNITPFINNKIGEFGKVDIYKL